MYQSWPSPNWSLSVKFRASSSGTFLSGFRTMLSTHLVISITLQLVSVVIFIKSFLSPKSFLQLLLVLLGSYCCSNPHSLQSPPLLPTPKWITMPGDTYLLPALLWPKNTSVCAAHRIHQMKEHKEHSNFPFPDDKCCVVPQSCSPSPFPVFHEYYYTLVWTRQKSGCGTLIDFNES